MMNYGRFTASWIAALVCLAGLALRLPGLFTDFWLDEIWPYTPVQALDHATQVFTAVHHDSNHWLSSLWMFALGSGRDYWLYRLPSIAAGVLSVPAAGWLTKVESRGRVTAWPAMLLTATSFPLILYSTEARGYASAVLFALLAVSCLLLEERRPGGRALVAYWGSVALGLLSHLLFVTVFTAAIAYSSARCLQGRQSARGLVWLHGPPALFLAALSWIDLRHLELGGGPPLELGKLLVDTSAFLVGATLDRDALRLAMAAVSAGLLAWVLYRGLKLRLASAYFATAAFAMPLWFVLIVRPPFFFPRYFLLGLPLLLVALPQTLTKPLSRRARIAIVAVWLAVNLSSWRQFLEEGRGHYRDALQYVLSSDQSPVVRIESDHDFRNGTVIAFYRDALSDGARLVYVEQRDAQGDPPDWYIQHSQDPSFTPSPRHDGRTLTASYDASTISGMRWFLYRRATGAP